MEAETETQKAPKPAASSELKPVERVAKPQLVVLTTDDAAVGVCNRSELFGPEPADPAEAMYPQGAVPDICGPSTLPPELGAPCKNLKSDDDLAELALGFLRCRAPFPGPARTLF